MYVNATKGSDKPDRTERDLPTVPEHSADGRFLIDTGPSRAGAHQMETFEICPRMYRLIREAAEEPRVAGLAAGFYLNRGSLTHIGLAHYHAIRAIREHGRVQIADERVTDVDRLYPPIEAVHVAAEAHYEWRGSLTESDMLVRRYVEWAESNPHPWVVIGIEVELGIMLTPTELYTARVDMLVKDRVTGLIQVVDHKTAYAPTDAPRMYGHGWQMLGIAEIGRELYGAKWGGIVLNCIASAPNPKVSVVRLPPASAPALAGRFREQAIARRKELRAVTGAVGTCEGQMPLESVPFRPSSCWRPREGLCPVYQACGVR